MSGSRGSRGGSTHSLEHAKALFREWKGDEWGWLKARIVWLASTKGEFHGDQLADVELSERNIIGAVVSGLVTAGYLTSTGVHRRSRSSASHGRRSYVYRLTPEGEQLAEALLHLVDHDIEALPKRPKPPPEPPKPESLFDSIGERIGPQSAITQDEPPPVERGRKRPPPKGVVINEDFFARVAEANRLRDEDKRRRRERDAEEERSGLSWDAD